MKFKKRIAAGWGAFGQYRDILKSKMPLSLRRKVYNQCIQAAMTYGVSDLGSNQKNAR